MIGILSDAHGNIPAFRSAVNCLRNLGAKKFLYLGDALGYIPETGVISELLQMKHEVENILGNHEFNIINNIKSDLPLESIYQHEKIRAMLSDEQFEYIKSWSLYSEKEFNDVKVLFVHGGPDDYVNQYLYPDTDLSQVYSDYDFVFMGHSHYPFKRKVNGTVYVNVGSCGLPRDDGRYGSFVLFNEENGNVNIYRYKIQTNSFGLLCGEDCCIHESVSKLFKRRREEIIGDLVRNTLKNSRI